jgi:hypothetical protein
MARSGAPRSQVERDSGNASLMGPDESTSDAVPRRSRPKKRWSDLTAGQRTAIVLGALAELIITTIALRDLVRRPSEHVRGWKPLWLLTLLVQPVGPVMYFLVGRRPPRH